MPVPRLWSTGNLFPQMVSSQLRDVCGSSSLILCEIVLSPQFGLGGLVMMREVGLPARAEIDMTTPDAAQGRFGVPIVVCAKLAGLARIFLLFHI